MERSHQLPRAPVVVAGLFGLAIALLVLPRTPGIGDSAEFTLALALAGIPHPTGYPLYVLAGHGFVVLAHALGAGWVLAANLWSALGAAVAAALFARLAQHVLAATAGREDAPDRGVEAIAAVLPAMLLALHPVWITSATIAEVYSWHHAWLAGAGIFALGRLRRIDAGAGPLTARDALLGGLIAGAGAAHHALAVFFVVPLAAALVVAHVRAGGRPVALLPALAGALVPLGGCAWLAWRAAHPAASQWPLDPAPLAVLAHATGSAYRSYLGAFAPKPAEWAVIRATILPLVLPGLLFGTLAALRVRGSAARGGLLALAAGAALVVVFVSLYGVPDPAMYFLSPLLVVLTAVAPAWRALARRSALVALAVAAALALGTASASLPRAFGDRARLDRIDARLRAAWALVPFERGIVLWSDDHFARLVVFQKLEGSRPGLDVVNPSLLTWAPRRAEFARRWGFDALAGGPPRTGADVARIAGLIRAQAPVPVVEFPDVIERVRRAER